MASQIMNPYDQLKKQNPVQPSMTMNQPGVPAPQLAQRPAQQPAVRTGSPGPVIGAPGQPQSVIKPVDSGQPKAPAQPALQGLGYNVYGQSGGTAANAPAGTLEAGLRDYITKGMQGVTSKQFVDRSKQDLAAATEGSRASNVNRINEDAIRRGLFRSGIPAEQAAAAGRASQSAFATGLSDILKSAEQQNIAGREAAAGQASNLLSQNRAYDQYTQQRIDAENARRAAAANSGPKTFSYIDPDTGQAYELPADF